MSVPANGGGVPKKHLVGFGTLIMLLALISCNCTSVSFAAVPV